MEVVEFKGNGKSVKTMDSVYGDGSDHLCCPDCGLCLTCFDCGCENNFQAEPQKGED